MTESDLTRAFDAILRQGREANSTLLERLAKVEENLRRQEMMLRLQDVVLTCAAPAARQVFDSSTAEQIERGMASVIPCGRAALPSPELGDIAFRAGSCGGNHPAASLDAPLSMSSDTVASESLSESLLASTQPTATDAVTVEDPAKTNPMASSQSSLATTQSHLAAGNGETGYPLGSNLETFSQRPSSESPSAFDFSAADEGFGSDYADLDLEPLGFTDTQITEKTAENNLAGMTSQRQSAERNFAGITSQGTSAGEDLRFQGSSDTQFTEQAPIERIFVIQGSMTPSKRRASLGSQPLEGEVPS
ncbi:hypothetical protein W97_07895 [Coniosporium apollinis CBS 100218]|uniref:Uncharacterized protein n=1 Tax=Coniosporium apollinis (strain CBS 100218) TaxID=1168221 RepID=R7Z3B6_CONA1|nr:uncharacterized protein W97_07895 [Coniosporium apollinis CBS 100218]EON68637.1 hypothetical protein W97_07895 [Coniosporium apollinis CBS 100218]